jgi:ketosteroid isomerase-like protein
MLTIVACRLAMTLALISAAAAPPPEPPPAPPPPSVALPPELDRVLRDYEQAWQARDAAVLAALFAEDGFVLASGRPPARGRAEIRAAYAGAGGPLALRALAHATEGRVGYIIGAFGRVKGEDSGKFVLALRRGDDGRWLIAADIDNSNRRPSAPPATMGPGATAPPR